MTLTFCGVAGQAKGREAFARFLEDLQNQRNMPLAFVRTTAIGHCRRNRGRYQLTCE